MKIRMKKTRLTTEQIIRILRESEGLNVEEACRKHEISAPTYHRWKAKYAGMGIKEAQQLRDLEKENAELKKLLDEAETYWQLVLDYEKQGTPLWDIIRVAAIPQVQSLLQRQSEHKINIAALAERYQEKHPKMILAQESLRQLEKELKNALRSARKKARSSYLRAKDNYQRSLLKLQQKEKDVIKLSKLRVQYNSMLRDLKVSQTLYQYLLRRMQEHSNQINIANSNIRILDKPLPAAEPYSPRVVLNFCLGGIFIGISFTFLMDLIDNQIESRFDIERLIKKVPLMGTIPRISSSQIKKTPAIIKQDSRIEERFRNFYFSIKLNKNASAAQTLLVTSTLPNEGKSVVALNLALIHAQRQEKVILIDCDLRASILTKRLKLEDSQGLLPYLQSPEPSGPFIHRNALDSIDIVTAGDKTKRATHLLASPRFADLLSQLKQDYDKILIDTPPIGIVSDPLTLLPIIDGMLYVVRTHRVEAKLVKYNLTRIQESNVPFIGTVLSGAVTDQLGHPMYN